MNYSEKALSYMQSIRVGDHPIETFIKVINPLPIAIHKGITVQFTLQNGPVKEEGVNGCQVLDMMYFTRNMIIALNGDFPCEENKATIEYLNQAIIKQVERTANRVARGVEGTSQN